MDFVNDQKSYAVEVSGWDVAETFFVERTDLNWTPEGVRQIRLQRPVREGGMLFVRLLQPLSQSDSYPVACRAVKVLKHEAGGFSLIQLAQLRPRAFLKDTLRQLSASSSKVA